MTSIKIDYIVTGDQNFCVDQFSNLLNIDSSMIRRKGEKIGRSSRVYEDDVWFISSGYVDTYDVGQLMELILNKMDGKAELIHSLEGIDSQISVAIKVRSEAPIINLTPLLISNLSELRASLDIDIILLE